MIDRFDQIDVTNRVPGGDSTRTGRKTANNTARVCRNDSNHVCTARRKKKTSCELCVSYKHSVCMYIYNLYVIACISYARSRSSASRITEERHAHVYIWHIVEILSRRPAHIEYGFGERAYIRADKRDPRSFCTYQYARQEKNLHIYLRVCVRNKVLCGFELDYSQARATFRNGKKKCRCFIVNFFFFFKCVTANLVFLLIFTYALCVMHLSREV